MKHISTVKQVDQPSLTRNTSKQGSEKSGNTIKEQTLHVAVKLDRNIHTRQTRALITNSPKTNIERSQVRQAHQSNETGDDST